MNTSSEHIVTDSDIVIILKVSISGKETLKSHHDEDEMHEV